MELVEALSKAQQVISSKSLNDKYQDDLNLVRTKRDVMKQEWSERQKKRTKREKKESKKEQQENENILDRIKNARERNKQAKQELESECNAPTVRGLQGSPHLDKQIDYYKEKYRKLVESGYQEWEQISQSRKGGSRACSRNGSAVFSIPVVEMASNPNNSAVNQHRPSFSPNNYTLAFDNVNLLHPNVSPISSNNASMLAMKSSVASSRRPSVVSFSPELHQSRTITDPESTLYNSSDQSIPQIYSISNPFNAINGNLEQIVKTVVDQILEKKDDVPLSFSESGAKHHTSSSSSNRVVYVNEVILKSPQSSLENVKDVTRPKNLDLRVLISNQGPDNVDINYSNLKEGDGRTLAQMINSDSEIETLSNLTISQLSLQNLNDEFKINSGRKRTDKPRNEKSTSKPPVLEILYEYIEKFYQGGSAIFQNTTSGKLLQEILLENDNMIPLGCSVNAVSDAILSILQKDEPGFLPKEFLPYIPLHEDFVADFNYTKILGLKKGEQLQRLIQHLRFLIDKDPKIKKHIVLTLAHALIPKEIRQRQRSEVNRAFVKIARLLAVKLPKTMADEDIFVEIERAKIKVARQ